MEKELFSFETGERHVVVLSAIILQIINKLILKVKKKDDRRIYKPYPKK